MLHGEEVQQRRRRPPGRIALYNRPVRRRLDGFEQTRQRPLTVGLAIFGAPESGVDWSIISAATLLAVAPLLVAFLLFQRQFVQSFMYAGIK